MKRAYILLASFLLLLSILLRNSFATNFTTLLPTQVLVVANKNVPQGVKLAKYYMSKRHIPKQNLLILSTVTKENCSRRQYNLYIASPIREFLKTHKGIRCILLMYGMPLKIGPTPIDNKAQRELNKILKSITDIKNQITKLRLSANKIDKSYKKRLNKFRKQLRLLQHQKLFLSPRATTASVDSELALVQNKPYELCGWIPNRLFLGTPPYLLKNIPPKVIMVSRLDAPSAKIVKRIIDDSIYAQNHGLEGIAYFDARWHMPKANQIEKIKRDFSYKYFDWSIHLAAQVVRQSGVMPVVLDQKPSVFKPDSCPKAALYCGWYSLGHYVNAFSWQRGSVGYHIASVECSTLHNKNSTIWCVKMLEKGICATLGPVREPYIEAFPIPEVFFTLLLDGRFTLAQCYAYSKRFWSWQMVLIGDPLYRPFAYRALLHPLNENPINAYRKVIIVVPRFLTRIIPEIKIPKDLSRARH